MVSMATILAFHAHPGDEVLLTGGTLARLAAEGNRVVVAVATDGVMGEAAGAGTARRLQELRASASVLGVARIVHLGVLEATLPRELIVLIDPRDTRPLLCAWVRDAYRVLPELTGRPSFGTRP